MSTRHDQRGLTLTEVLASILLIGIVFAGIAAAVLALTRSTATASDSSRVNVVATGVGEALKAMDYQQCELGDLAPIYQEAYDRNEAALVDELRLLPDRSDVAVRIIAVDPLSGCDVGSPDTGEQLIEFEVQLGEVARTEQILKRNPDYSSDFAAAFDAELISVAGDPIAVFSLDASGSSPVQDILQYRWECGDDGATVEEQDVPTGFSCQYPASVDAPTEYTITLTITDARGRVTSAVRTVVVPQASVARPKPVAAWTASCVAASCSSGSDPYLTGTADLRVQFDASGSQQPDGEIVSYEWDFGDEESGEGNTSTEIDPTHLFVRDKTYSVTLTVTDEIGLRSSLTRTIRVNRTTPPPPIASFTRTPAAAVAPQTIAFDARASRPDPSGPGTPIETYEWDWGDGSPVAFGTNPTPSKTYSVPGTYNVRLTVTDTAGRSASVTASVRIGSFTSPTNFRLTDSRGVIPFIRGGNFYFAWTNGERSSTDTVRYEIQIRSVFGCFAFGDQTRTVTAGAVGALQTYDWSGPWYSSICLGSTYEWRVRTLRTSPTNGTSATAWTQFERFTIGRL